MWINVGANQSKFLEHGAGADELTRLVIKSLTSLFDYDDRDCRIIVNKNGESDTASMISVAGIYWTCRDWFVW